MYAYGCWASAMNHEDMEKRARLETGNTLDKWLDEKSFVYLPEFWGRTRAFAFFACCLMVFMFFTLIGIITWFIVNVFILKKTSKTMNDKSTFLLVAVLAQTGSTVFFFILPFIIVTYCWTFAADDSGNVVNIAVQFLTFNGTIDMLTLLYFVKPYKVYCINLMRRFSSRKKHKSTAEFLSAHQSISVY
uniref:G_PROTEIN_RECEP_F1_2 domain-containing protein n=1 Tax=Panagrellus redivivus TaxID=6233 RepID=A0A7E4V1R4_PANRE